MKLILLVLVFETVGKKTCQNSLIAAETGYAHQSPQLETATEEKYLLISCFCEEGLFVPTPTNNRTGRRNDEKPGRQKSPSHLRLFAITSAREFILEDFLSLPFKTRQSGTCLCKRLFVAEGEAGDINYDAKLLSEGLICGDERKACHPPKVQYSTHLPSKRDLLTENPFFFFFFPASESLFLSNSVNKPVASH